MLPVLWAGILAASAAAAGDCPTGPDRFERLRELATASPEIVFSCVPRLSRTEQRDFLLRLAFTTAAADNPDLARRQLTGVVDRAWIDGIGFYPALTLAGGAAPDLGRKLMMAAARRNPSLALRDTASYAPLAYGLEIFDQAVMAAPDEAVGLAARNPALLGALRSRRSREFAALAGLAADPSMNGFERERAAVFFRQIARGDLSMDAARGLTRDDRFFPAVVRLRLGADALEAEFLDRVLDRTARMLFRWFEDGNPALSRFSAADTYMLLACGTARKRTTGCSLRSSTGCCFPNCGARSCRICGCARFWLPPRIITGWMPSSAPPGRRCWRRRCGTSAPWRRRWRSPS